MGKSVGYLALLAISFFATTNGTFTNSSTKHQLAPLVSNQIKMPTISHTFHGHLAVVKKEVLSDDMQSKLKALRKFSQVLANKRIYMLLDFTGDRKTNISILII
jgi:hypothetical protein